MQASETLTQPGLLTGFRAPNYSPEMNGATSPQMPQGKVLIVEDDHLIALAMESALTDAGLDVIGVVATAEEAIPLAHDTKPDIIVMDIRLAGLRDGVDAALELHRDAGFRCLFATAHSDSATRHRAQPARPLGWLAKPFQPNALVQAVRSALIEKEKT